VDDDSALTIGPNETGPEMSEILSSDTPGKPFMTGSLPGTGGSFKATPEDFIVEEIPAFPFSGEGEHLILLVEKRGITTQKAKELLARAFGVFDEAVGFAGIKDAYALTRQNFSIHTKAPLPLENSLSPNLRIISTTRHIHKLRAGMLSGNRFDIIVRGPKSPENAGPILEEIFERGLPNYYGAQRFGSQRNVSGIVGSFLARGDFENALRAYVSETGESESEQVKRARKLFSENDLKGALESFPRTHEYEIRLISNVLSGNSPEKAFRKAIPKNLLRLFVSASQSQVFNEILAQRIETLDQFIDGDIGMFSKGATFFKKVSPDDPRLKGKQVSPSGLLFGSKVPLAEGRAGEIERAALEKFSIKEGDLPGFKKLPFSFDLDGSRRRLREILPDPPETEIGEGFLRIRFSLPKGTYATELLREVMK